MKLWNYLQGILAGFILGWVVFVAIVTIQIGSPTGTTKFLYEIDQKHLQLAKAIQKPKFVIASGSNSHFGISCQILQAETKVPCLNGAKPNAGLGVEYILHRTKLLLNPGDTVFMPLEYELYLNENFPPDETLIDYVFARDPQYVFTHPQFFAFISFPRLFQGFLAKIKPPTSTAGYQIESVNAYGDNTGNREADMTEAKRQKIDSFVPMEIKFNKDKYALKVIKEFAIWCKKNKIELLASWPNTIYFDVYKQPKTQQEFSKMEQFYRDINVTVIGKPTDFMYDKSKFYDTMYHLTDRGVRERTHQLISMIQPYLIAERIKDSGKR